MRPTELMLALLEALGVPALELRSADDPGLSQFAATHGIDLASVRALASAEGPPVRSNDEWICVRHEDGVLVGARPQRARGEAQSEQVLHEVRNAITAVAGWARIARREGGATLRADQALGAIEAAAMVAMDASAARGVESDRRLGERRGMVGERRGAVVAVGALVTQVLELLEPLAQERRVLVHPSIGAELRVAMPRASALSAIHNLLKNAIEASQPGDEVMIRASRSATTSAEGRGLVEITVANPTTATGVPQIGRSSKGAGRGVGLSVVSSVAQSAGGSLKFSRGAGGLLLATLRLPEPGAVAEPSVEEVTAQLSRDRQRSDGMASGTRRAARHRDDETVEHAVAQVLVVDDEASIRSLVTTALSISGIGAVAVAHPDELGGDRRVFELALVDLRLGDHDGLDVARQLRAEGRARKVVLMTGAPIGQKPADILAIVRKPFDLDELQGRIAEWTGAPDARKVARSRR